MPLLTKEKIQKTFKNTPPFLPSFYICPYADPNPGQLNDYSLIYFPNPSYQCDINFAFITPSEDLTSGTFGNTISDTYLKHLRDLTATQQLIARMQFLKRRIFVSFIDTPNIHWDKVNIENFVRNTEGEIAPDGTLLSNFLMDTYHPIGRMWDAETDGPPEALAEIIKACFLRGLQREPDNYVFIYTTYENRSIDQIILSTPIDPTKSSVDKALYDLGFTQISDFITHRGSLSFLETMSYGAPAEDRFQEADNYALQLAKADSSKLNEMRKFISIGVSPETDEDDAITIAKACDSSKEAGYGRFMVWAGNCPEGVSLFETMCKARLTQETPDPEAFVHISKPSSFLTQESGNRRHFNSFFKYKAPFHHHTPSAISSFFYRIFT